MNAQIPSGIISHVFAAAGKEEEKIRSVRPAEKENPPRKPTMHVITVNNRYSRE